MKYKAVIFDLDGVLCSTDDYHYLAWKSMADQLGIPFDREKNNRLRGVSRVESLEIVLEEYQGEPLSAEKKRNLMEEKNCRYRAYLQNMGPEDLPGGVAQTLQKLRARGLKLAVGSSSKNAALILERLGLERAFDAVADGTHITHSKPDPEVFLLASQMLGLDPGDCLVVEDAEAGIAAATAGGFDSAALGSAINAGHGTYHLDRLEDLLTCCLSFS